MQLIHKWIGTTAAAVLLVMVMIACSADAPPVGGNVVDAATPGSNDIYLQQGDRFTVVCAYKGAVMVYGDNSDNGNPPTGIAGVCE